jgi:signal transduction histidine kinase
MESPNLLCVDERNYVLINTLAKSKSICRNEIVKSIAFELRTPVAVIKSNIQLLKKFCINTENSLAEESFLLCEDSVDNIFRFINCVNFLSDADQGKLRLKKKSFNLKRFLNQVMEELRCSNFDISRINVDLAVSNLNVIADQYLLNRIVVNLIVNALKFSRSRVELIISENNNNLTLEVRDYGIGIPEEEIADVFNPFVRASNVKMISGTGLGLSIVSRAVECLDGEMYVNSILGKGTDFKIIIPVGPMAGKKSKSETANDMIPQL